jgi:hypothetical protein
MKDQKNADDVEALCPECGHAFKTFVDRLLREETDAGAHPAVPCPVCGCGQCHLDH